MLTFDLSHPHAGTLLANAFAARPPRLDLAAVAVAALEEKEIAHEPVLDHLDVLAHRVLAHAREGWTAREQLDALRRVLVEEEGFRGNRERYDDPLNSFINCVLDRKVGIPISLSVVWIEVARRAGVPLYGISFPGHFLVGLGEGGSRLVVDPFDGGRVLSASDCEKLLRRAVPAGRLEEALFRPASTHAIVWRMLTNLKNLYVNRGDHLHALHVEDLLLQLAPDHPGELRSRAALLSSVGAFKAALEDLDRILELGPAPDRPMILEAAKVLRERIQYMH